MRLRIRNWMLALAAGFAVVAAADAAAAQCCEPPPPCCEPPPPPPPPPCETGCTPYPPTYPPGGGNVNVNVNVNAGAYANAGANSYVNARAGGFSGSRAGGFGYGYGYGGGSAYVSVESPAPTTIQGLAVEGMAMQTVRTPFTAFRSMMKRVVIQAVCIDDRQVPHPASQVRPDREVAEGYEGELYRCLAGTWLQATIADYEGDISFDQGETLTCKKHEALWYGGDGRLECRPEKPERDCNERSLLRRYGAGLKILTLYREEEYTEYREEVVEGTAVMTGSITLDGGVGGRVF